MKAQNQNHSTETKSASSSRRADLSWMTLIDRCTASSSIHRWGWERLPTASNMIRRNTEVSLSRGQQ